MKNLNLNALIADVYLNSDEKKLSLLNVVNSAEVNVDVNNMNRIIEHISIVIMLSASQSKDEEYVETLNPDETFVFHEKYELRVRLTETITGKFRDLGTIDIDPAQHAVQVCRNTFNGMYFGLYDNIPLPKEIPNEKFVIKLLIKRKTSEQDEWIVQTVIPIDVERKTDELI